MNEVDAFRALHGRERPLLLPNVWDAASAALVRWIGAEAVATTSAGVAWAAGYADGGTWPQAERHAALRAICRAAHALPVTVDAEAGYSDDPERVALAVCELRALGVAGINLEDGDGDPALLERKIAATKRTLHAAGDDIFINARIDVYLRRAGSAGALDDALARARRYAAAGADGIFAAGVAEPAAIRALAAATALPLNTFAVPSLTAAGLFGLGVRRISAGESIAARAYGAARVAARAFLDAGGLPVEPNELGYAEMNALVSPAQARPGTKRKATPSRQ